MTAPVNSAAGTRAGRSWPARVLTVVGALAGAALVVGGSASLAVAVATRATTVEHSYPAVATVELSATDVHVYVVPVVGDQADANVLVTASALSAWRTPDYTATNPDGDRLVVEHRCADSWASGPDCSAGLFVQVTAGTRVVVHGRDVTVDGPAAAVDVTLEGVGGARISGTHGDVVVRGDDRDGATAGILGVGVQVADVTGDVDVASVPGPVDVADVVGSVSVQAAGNGVVVEGATGDVDARAAAGSVTVIGTGEPVALSIVGNVEHVEGPTDPRATTRVTIVAPLGDAWFKAPPD